MPARHTAAIAGVLAGLVAAFAVAVLCLWGVARWVRCDLQKNTGPIRRVDTRPTGR